MPDNYNIVNGTYENLDSNMPASIDNFDRMNDISVNELAAKQSFDNYISNGQFTEAAAVIQSNPNLAACLFNADKYNKLRDALIATQLTFVDNASNAIWHAMENKGEYNSSNTYYKHNIVHYNNNYYMAMGNNFTNILPTNSEYWITMTIKGDTGETGTGLIPSGEWTNSNTYYYYSDSSNYIHASMVYYNNCLYQCITNGISGDSNSPTNAPENWEIIMSLQTSAQDIVTDYGNLSDILLKVDNLNDILILNDNYTYNMTKNNNLFIESVANSLSNIVSKTSEKNVDGSWTISYYIYDNLYRRVKFQKVNNNWESINLTI